MIASLPMYARPELHHAHMQFWDLIRANLIAAGIKAPQKLSQDMIGIDAWLRPDLVFSQTCGMPYRTALHGKVTLIGTPDYGLKGCPKGYYRSTFIVRKSDEGQSLSDYTDSLFAFNDRISQSGLAAPMVHAKQQGVIFKRMFQSGSHLNSARVVAEGSADIASLDAVSWRLMQQYEEFASDLRVLEWTEPTPGLPYITKLGEDGEQYFQAVAQALKDLPNQSRDDLGIIGLEQIPAPTYLNIPNP